MLHAAVVPFSHALRVLFPAGGVVMGKLAALHKLTAVLDFRCGDDRHLWSACCLSRNLCSIGLWCLSLYLSFKLEVGLQVGQTEPKLTVGGGALAVK